MRSEKKTIYDIAKEAGVSAATVSRVLSGYKNVSQATHDKVMRIIDKHGFMPSSLARGLYRRSSRTVGMILPGVENPYYAVMFTAAYDEAQRQGYSLLMYRTSPMEPVRQAFIDQLIEQRLDGVLLLGGIVESTQQPMTNLAPMLNRLQAHMPLVTICPPIPGVDCINFHSDLSASVRQSVRHLNALGHKRIAFLGGSYQSRSASEREMGFLDEMEHLGLSTAYRHEAGHTPEAGELGALKLLSMLHRANWPTALIAINDLVALGAIRQLKKMNVRIPYDMAIVGCDNQFFSPYTDPPLTTVDNHPAELGCIAMEQLLALAMQSVDLPVFTQVRESTLVVRESCGARLGRRELL